MQYIQVCNLQCQYKLLASLSLHHLVVFPLLEGPLPQGAAPRGSRGCGEGNGTRLRLIPGLTTAMSFHQPKWRIKQLCHNPLNSKINTVQVQSRVMWCGIHHSSFIKKDWHGRRWVTVTLDTINYYAEVTIMTQVVFISWGIHSALA